MVVANSHCVFVDRRDDGHRQSNENSKDPYKKKEVSEVSCKVLIDFLVYSF